MSRNASRSVGVSVPSASIEGVNLADVQALASQGEGIDLEFKKSTGELDAAARSLCGMLNAGVAATVLFGVTPAGQVRGQQVSEKTLEEIASAFAKFQPAVSPSVERIRLPSGTDVLVVSVAAPKSSVGPFLFDGRAFLRKLNTTRAAEYGELYSRFRDQVWNERSWDSLPAEGVTLSDLDDDDIGAAVADGQRSARIPTGSSTSNAEVVLRLNLLTEGKVTRAAALVFGRSRPGALLRCDLRLARFAGVDKQRFLDNQQFAGNLCQALEAASTFIGRHTQVASSFVPGKLQRVDTPEYPTSAVREALVNAFAHRDYSAVGGAVSVGIYSDRLEIESTGALPFGLRLDELEKSHQSRPRNPLIAHVFYVRGWIESWGRGMELMAAESQRAGCRAPQFEVGASSFLVRLFPRGITMTEVRGIAAGLRERVLAELKGAGALSSSELAVRADVSSRSLQRVLSALVEEGVIVAQGRGRARRYALPT